MELVPLGKNEMNCSYYMKRISAITLFALLLAVLTLGSTAEGFVIQRKKVGFSMRLWMDNRGVFGIQARPGGYPNDSLGCEYPIGSNVEHIFGGGMWVGSLFDTSSGGGGTPLKLVTTSYEGWAGPPPSLVETYPGNNPGDTIWVTSRFDTVEPPGWSDYWGSELPFDPISDRDFYMRYTDYVTPQTQHIPLGLKYVQSVYTWNDPYADAIIIVEYKLINTSANVINDAYIGWFFEADVGPITSSNYWTRDFTAYIEEEFTAYIHNPIDEGSTPIGATLLWPQDTTLKYTFAWFPGQDTPTPDNEKYDVISPGIIEPDEYPQVSDTRFLFAFGPFTIKPPSDPEADTLRIAIGIISGFSRLIDHRIVLQNNARRAKDIYLNRGITLPPTPPSPPLRVSVGFRSVTLDWKWRVGDDSVYAGHDDPRIYGRNNPEANWDTTNQVARRYPSRYQAPHPIGHPTDIDTTRGGRNFEAYRVWRSENPLFPDASFTLLREFDVVEDSLPIGYNTGLQFTFTDSNLVRGKTYVYSVTSISIPSLAYQTIPAPPPDSGNIVVEVPVEPLESSKLVNATRIDLPFSVSKELGKVSVVPNPYRTDQDYTLESGGYEGLFSLWDENKRLVKFINLPEVCTIRIFSLGGDLVRTIEHDGRSVMGISRGDVNVPLVSESNRALASGVYIFTVESEFGVQTGKFVIIR
jgi:hypothetical protein